MLRLLASFCPIEIWRPALKVASVSCAGESPAITGFMRLIWSARTLSGLLAASMPVPLTVPANNVVGRVRVNDCGRFSVCSLSPPKVSDQMSPLRWSSEPSAMYAVFKSLPLPKASVLRWFEVSCTAPKPETSPPSAMASA